MADAKTRLLDVWILEINTVYREVPFVVVTDWLQQGRLLAEDCVRLAGSKKWHAIRAVPALGPYLPKVAPQRAEDRAEALEPVELDVEWRCASEEEDDDVDMIPLIDISLVLLIFFMMTASVESGVLSAIATPSAQFQLATINRGTYWVGIDRRSRAGVVEKDDEGRPRPWFSLGQDNKELLKPTLDRREVIDLLAKELKETPAGEVTVRLRAEKTVPIEMIRDMTADLQALRDRLNQKRGPGERLTLTILGEVSEPKGR